MNRYDEDIMNRYDEYVDGYDEEMDMIDIVVYEYISLKIQCKTLYLSIDLFVLLVFHSIYSSILIPPS